MDIGEVNATLVAIAIVTMNSVVVVIRIGAAQQEAHVLALALWSRIGMSEK